MLTNLSAIEESHKLSFDSLANAISILEEKIEIGNKVSCIEMKILPSSTTFEEKRESNGRYIVSVSDEIIRLLTTPLGSRVMRPKYGSELYKLRDRELNTEWRLWAIKYTFEAINRYIERVRCRKVLFELQGDGKIKMKLELEER